MRLVMRIMAGVALAAANAGAAHAATITVTVKDMKFTPATVSAHVGDTIVWTNGDFVAHTATARDKSWDVTIAAGKSASVTVNAAGTFAYFCRFHPMMVGEVDVQ
jgi:plastocyanin